MEINFHKTMDFSDTQREYVERKIGRLKKLAGRFWSPATLVSVDLKENKVSNSDQRVHCSIKMPLPGEVLYAKSDERTIEAAVDVVEDRLVHQLDRYKGKHS